MNPYYHSRDLFFFFNDTATTEIYTLSLHDALPIPTASGSPRRSCRPTCAGQSRSRSEEHTSELQSRFELVCRLLLEKKKGMRDPLRGLAERSAGGQDGEDLLRH